MSAVKPAQHGAVSPKSKSLKAGKAASDVQALQNDLIKAAATRHQDRKSLAVELLIQGRPQAFVDFFLLTHASSEADGQPAQTLPLESLQFLQEQTTRAHDAVRGGDTQTAFDAYRQLGRYFSQLNQLDKAGPFYEKCNEVGGRQAHSCGCGWEGACWQGTQHRSRWRHSGPLPHGLPSAAGLPPTKHTRSRHTSPSCGCRATHHAGRPGRKLGGGGTGGQQGAGCGV
jgi:hypothetical protein